MKYDLFNPPPNAFNPVLSSGTRNIEADLLSIKGLTYVPNFLSIEEHDLLWSEIYKGQWLGDLKRRVQHYGWKYDYKARTINYSMYLGELPFWAKAIAQRLNDGGYMPQIADQVIVNEYQPGQGIAPHVDCKPCFGNTIISISLGSSLVMDFVNLKSKNKIEILVEPRSLVVISDEARYDWTHGIAARKVDTFHHHKFERKLRTSLTFRHVIVEKANSGNI